MKKAAVLGFPIHHSLSPKLHGYWLKKYGIEGSYEAIEVRPGTLGVTFSRLIQEGYVGWNITIPHKEEALHLMHTIDETAKQIGAVNTVVVDKEGKLKGYNTDAFGFIQNLKHQHTGALANKIVMVLGAGGAARAVISGLLMQKENDQSVKAILVTNRSSEKAEQLVAYFGKKLTFIPWNEKEKVLNQVDILVNTTSLGMQGSPELEINLTTLPITSLVTDIVYKPLSTTLLKRATERGNPIADGIGMLLWQAVPGFEHWFGHKPEVTDELKKYMLSLC
jgi:shikimate dehydrogenase